LQPEDPEKLSKKELKRRAKAAEKEKDTVDPTKPVEEKVVGAVDYSKDFFGKRVNLTVSGQLNVETHACALSDVYTFGPTFRAENSHTGRHLAEFWMIEPEICFADLSDDINLAEDYLKYCVKFALENCAEDLEFFENSPHGEAGLRDRLKNVLDNPFVVSVFIWNLGRGTLALVMTKKTQWESLRVVISDELLIHQFF
jgi:tRNA synthetases class II (D, K and N)